MTLALVLGPRRSGKSAVAERLATGGGAPVVFLAPLTVADDEMAARVRAHRARRPPEWTTVESGAPLDALRGLDERATVLLDSLGTWVSEALWRAAAGSSAGDVDAFAEHAAARPGLTVVVAEEAGWGPVPPSAATRRWLDALGDAAQALSRRADRALLVVAGRAQELV